MNVQLHGIKRIQPTDKRVELFLPDNLPMCLSESETLPLAIDGLTVLLFCDIHIDKGATLNLLIL